MEERVSEHQGTLSENKQLEEKKIESNEGSSWHLEMILKFLEEDFQKPKVAETCLKK